MDMIFFVDFGFGVDDFEEEVMQYFYEYVFFFVILLVLSCLENDDVDIDEVDEDDIRNRVGEYCIDWFIVIVLD